MAVKTTGTQPAAAPSADPPAPPAADPAPPAAPADTTPDKPARVESDCVVDADYHTGRAVNGLVCSYHAMHYGSDGKRRT